MTVLLQVVGWAQALYAARGRSVRVKYLGHWRERTAVMTLRQQALSVAAMRARKCLLVKALHAWAAHAAQRALKQRRSEQVGWALDCLHAKIESTQRIWCFAVTRAAHMQAAARFARSSCMRALAAWRRLCACLRQRRAAAAQKLAVLTRTRLTRSFCCWCASCRASVCARGAFGIRGAA
jgi:hypothetical protein